MARDFENIHDLEDLSDDELREVVREHLAAHNGLDVDDLSVRAADGYIYLGGRVGTEAERRIAEHIVTDQLGIVNVRNEILIDPIRRAQSPEAMDEHLAEEQRTEGLLLGDKPEPFTDTAFPVDTETDEQTWGTTNEADTISGGHPWIPPESQTPEGLAGNDAELPDMGEDH